MNPDCTVIFTKIITLFCSAMNTLSDYSIERNLNPIKLKLKHSNCGCREKVIEYVIMT